MSLGREHGKMIKNTYAAACGNERRQHEKVFQRNMRRTGDAFDPVHPIDGGGAHGGAGLRHHALCGTGGHGGASVVRRGAAVRAAGAAGDAAAGGHHRLRHGQ